VHSLFSYDPGVTPKISHNQCILAIPMKRDRQPTDITYLTDRLKSPHCWQPGPGDRSGGAPRIAPSGRHTGMRVSELTGLRLNDIHLATAHTSLPRQGRKDRATPLDPDTVRSFARSPKDDSQLTISSFPHGPNTDES